LLAAHAVCSCWLPLQLLLAFPRCIKPGQQWTVVGLMSSFWRAFKGIQKAQVWLLHSILAFQHEERQSKARIRTEFRADPFMHSAIV